MIAKDEATYQSSEEVHGKGMFFFTDCCHNRMYSVNKDPMFYHGKLCPKCFWFKNKSVTLYLRGTEEGIRVFNEKWDKGEYGVNGYKGESE